MKPKAAQESPGTREALLSVALELFKKKGFDETTMRDISKASGVALGAAYYYFKSKDEFVLEFYSHTHEEAVKRNEETVKKTKKFEERLRDIIEFKLEQLSVYRKFVVVLARNAAEPQKRLSPFSKETQHLREAAISLINAAVQGSDLKLAKPLASYASRMFWYFQMAIIFFWINDESKNQRRTKQLLDHALKMALLLMRATTMPFLNRFNQQIIRLFQILDGGNSGNKESS